MATTTHKINALRSGTVNGADFEEEYVITFTYWPTEPITRSHPGAEPGIEFVKVEPPVATDGSIPYADLAQQRIDEWAADWLDDHYDEAVAAAIYDRMADEDDAADYARRSRIDARLMGDM